MIARHETHLEKVDIWSALAAPLPAGVISWRQDGRTINRDARRYGRPKTVSAGAATLPGPRGDVAADVALSAEPTQTAERSIDTMRTTDEPSCPKCGGRVWDNRLTKRNPKAPDFKCRDRSCDGVIWPAKPGQRTSTNGRGSDDQSDELPLVPDAEAPTPEADQIPF